VRHPAQASNLNITMQLTDRIAIPALIVTSIGVVATLCTVCAKLVASSKSFMRRQLLTGLCMLI
jgi:hypothetical protein